MLTDDKVNNKHIKGVQPTNAMKVTDYFNAIFNARRGKFSLFISLGGAIAALATARFAYSIGSKFEHLQAQVVTYNNEIKNIRKISDGLNESALFKTSMVSSPNDARVRHVVVVTEPTSTSLVISSDSLSDEKVEEKVIIIDQSTKSDTVQKDTIVVSPVVWNVLVNRTLTPITSGHVEVNKNFFSANVDLARTLNILAKSNSRLEAEKQALSQRIAGYEQEVALLKSQNRNGDAHQKGVKPN